MNLEEQVAQLRDTLQVVQARLHAVSTVARVIALDSPSAQALRADPARLLAALDAALLPQPLSDRLLDAARQEVLEILQVPPQESA